MFVKQYSITANIIQLVKQNKRKNFFFFFGDIQMFI